MNVARPVSRNIDRKIKRDVELSKRDKHPMRGFRVSRATLSSYATGFTDSALVSRSRDRKRAVSTGTGAAFQTKPDSLSNNLSNFAAVVERRTFDGDNAAKSRLDRALSSKEF